MNNRLELDCLPTNEVKYGRESIKKGLVKKMWRKVLKNEDRLPGLTAAAVRPTESIREAPHKADTSPCTHFLAWLQNLSGRVATPRPSPNGRRADDYVSPDEVLRSPLGNDVVLMGSSPVTRVDDNGKKFECAMIAGNVDKCASSSGDVVLLEGGRDDTLYPVAGWWMPSKKRAG
ncbi:hypothetical protein B0H17DRAFT_1135479 [Mycena rosella]|uniref:Uncharacterized protein n=1 Tax=Mycena rosella TaxID=1033263 RepID=A0AAD7DDK2_MYCRO|nr:hypothetical protein B0H17DRAFT_1135479 [Mycena rosella]